MAKQIITTVFDTRDHAQAAAKALEQAGIPAADVTLSPENARDELGDDDSYSTTAYPRKTGFMASLENLFGNYDDRHTYVEGVRRGGTLFTARVDDASVDRAVSILEQHGAVDLEEREATWRSEGWTGGTKDAALATTGVAGMGAAGLAMTGKTPVTNVVTTETRAPAAPVAPVAVAQPSNRAAAVTGNDEVVQVVEERLEVGKRAVNRGKVRLHTYVVENEVSENVTLRDETVSIDRRTVDRPVAALGEDAFRERTIEMEEVDEEAVVGKTVRVVEEIGIRKDVTDRTETIRDTVRSTKVDIDDSRTAGGTATGLGGSFASRLVKDLEVVGSDGVHVGMIDRLDGAMMKLKRMDPASAGQHHLLPTDLVQSVNDKAVLSIAAAEAMRRWKAA